MALERPRSRPRRPYLWLIYWTAPPTQGCAGRAAMPPSVERAAERQRRAGHGRRWAVCTVLTAPISSPAPISLPS